MPGVGGISCDLVKGNSNALAARVETWQVPGVNGHGAMDMGANDSEFRFQIIKYDTKANVNTWIDNIKALKGTIVSIVDDFGATHSNCLILRVSMPHRKAIVGPAAADTRGMVRIEGVITA